MIRVICLSLLSLSVCQFAHAQAVRIDMNLPKDEFKTESFTYKEGNIKVTAENWRKDGAAAWQHVETVNRKELSCLRRLSQAVAEFVSSPRSARTFNDLGISQIRLILNNGVRSSGNFPDDELTYGLYFRQNTDATLELMIEAAYNSRQKCFVPGQRDLNLAITEIEQASKNRDFKTLIQLQEGIVKNYKRFTPETPAEKSE